MDKVFVNSFEYNIIYVYEVKDERHKGMLKVGKASINTDRTPEQLPACCHELNQAAKERIKEYTNTLGLSSNPIYTELAVKTVKNDDDGLNLQAFSDHDVHRVLENSGYKKHRFQDSTGQEWFKVDLDTVKRAIQAVKGGHNNLAGTSEVATIEIQFRPEQKEAIKKTLKQYKTMNTMLWNAKMRFGKTLSALQVVKEANFHKTIIITHRPVVDDGWYEDFDKIFRKEDGYFYGSRSKGNSVAELEQSGKKFIYFASIQDLRGSSAVGGKFDKNDEVFNLDWDFIIIDEAHEGTNTELGENVRMALEKRDSSHVTKVLELSGTPFNRLDQYEDNIYTWDYVMEQTAKKEWNETHFGDSNPYEELPEMKIYTYDLGKLIKSDQYVELEDKAFNFREFFRTWTGDIKRDHKQMPENVQIGDFVHGNDVLSFLNLITKEDEESCYPYAKEEYRELFKHSLWMVPGVKEAKALSKMMRNHPVFGSGMFEIVNVAGEGDEEEKSEEAFSKVKKAIANAGEDGYTITLSCGKLTTGVTVREWTTVLMLAGSFSTSAANYLQTIFRVQSPCNKDGKLKTHCYVFDFAPDRTLKMVAEYAALSTKAGKTQETGKRIMGEFLNYCPVISVDGTRMKSYDTNKLLQQLKRAYAEKAVQNGFDDVNIYNDELLKLDDVDWKKFENLKKQVGTSKAAPKSKDIDLNAQGFTEEEYGEIQNIERKPKKERTPEEQALYEEAKKKKEQRNTAISILRAVSIRMPLLIYGANIDINEDFTLDMFLNDEIVDSASWDEFMPNGVTKEMFREFMKYYDPEIFVEAGRKIRNTVVSADRLPPTERVQKIADLFSCFKNPDKETVLTPWRVVNMHMRDCLGGYTFYDENNERIDGEPVFVEHERVTKDTLANKQARILEINSKTGLYPLYVAYSIYRARRQEYTEIDITVTLEDELWKETVENNVFVICKTPMAKQITKRTLAGFQGYGVNAHYFDDLVNMLENKPDNFVKKVTKESYWKIGDSEMKFDAIVGNPPYQQETGGAGRQAKPIYNLFVEQAKKVEPNYLSMITPSRWFSGGMGLDEFRINMTSDCRLVKIVDYTNAKDCFPQISISGGVSYFLWEKNWNGNCNVTNVNSGKYNTLARPLDEFSVFVRYNYAIPILRKILQNDFESIDQIISPLMPYGLSTNYRGRTVKSEHDSLTLYASTGITYINQSEISKGLDMIDSYKVMMSKMSAEHAGEPNKEGMFNVFTKSLKVLRPGEVCTHSYFLLGNFNNQLEAENLLSYLKTRFVRFIVMTTLSAVNLSKLVFFNVPMQDFSVSWTDEILYEKYGFSKDEIDYIESLINPM